MSKKHWQGPLVALIASLVMCLLLAFTHESRVQDGPEQIISSISSRYSCHLLNISPLFFSRGQKDFVAATVHL